MNITIHRPTQIGGQITCIATNQSKIIIDLGHDLPNNNQCKENRLATKHCNGLKYSRYKIQAYKVYVA